jgi:hypothetical protein
MRTGLHHATIGGEYPKGGAMATQANGQIAAVREPRTKPVRRLPDLGGSRASTAAQVHVYEAGDSVVVRMRLAEGPLELRIPKRALERLRQHRIAGCNPDATPC